MESHWASPVTLGSRLVLHCGTNTVMFLLPSFQKYSTAIAIPRQLKNFFRPWLEGNKDNFIQVKAYVKAKFYHRQNSHAQQNQHKHAFTL